MSQEPVVRPKKTVGEGVSTPRDALDQALVQIREALQGLEYGVLSIIVQDGVVVQIERTERKRLRRNS